MSDEVAMPTTIRELWRQGWVAETEDEAVAMAERMFALFHGREVEVDRLEFQWGGEHAACDELMFAEPWPRVVPVTWDEGSGWDGDVLYPMWTVRVETPGQVLTVDPHWHRRQRRFSLDYIAGRRWAYPIRTTAPGIGTAAGFGRKDALMYPSTLLAEKEDKP